LKAARRLAVMELPGLERLMRVCQQLDLGLRTKPPERASPAAGALVAGLPFDPVLAAVYTRLGQVSFATKIDGFMLLENNEGEYGLEVSSAAWRDLWQESFPLPLVYFAGEPGLAYYYATVPSLADELGRQPVVRADTYEVPHAIPVASNVDKLFDMYTDYLEALVTHPDYDPDTNTGFLFPWDVPHLMARDVRLVELIRAGAFDPLLTNDEVRAWTAAIAERGSHH
jgi:hypothetical protein